jgi:carbon starvation protein CstA
MSSGPGGVVSDVAKGYLGSFGGTLAVLSVILLSITSGDTAFRSARLILAEWTKLDQKKIVNRLIITIPLLGIGAVLTQLDFNVLWRYFSWSNQTLAMISLWVATAYLIKEGKKWKSLLTALPATFMSAVSLTYIMMAQEGLKLSKTISYPAGLIFALTLFVIYVVLSIKKAKQK